MDVADPGINYGARIDLRGNGKDVTDIVARVLHKIVGPVMPEDFGYIFGGSTRVVTTGWLPTPQEREELADGAMVIVEQMAPAGFNPIYVAVEGCYMPAGSHMYQLAGIPVRINPRIPDGEIWMSRGQMESLVAMFDPENPNA